MLRQDLLDALNSWGVGSAADIDGNVSLIRSGRLDSVALFNLSLWIEERVGRPVDPASFDLMQAWDTVDSILAFVSLSTATALDAKPTPPQVVTSSIGVVSESVQEGPAASGVRIIRYEPAFKDAAIALQRRLWSPDVELNRRFFEWRYEQNPFDDAPLIYLARRGDQIVGMRGLFRSYWEHGGTRSEWYCADDLVVATSDEGKGLFARFNDAARRDLAERGYSFYLSLSALRVTRLKSLATGARSVGTTNPIGRRTPAAYRADRFAAGLKRAPLLWRLSGALAPGDRAEAVFSRLKSHGDVQRDQLTIRFERAPDSVAMAALVSSSPNDGRIRQVRDQRYLDWRFNSPLHEYRFVFAYAGANLVGYLALERGISAYANQRRINIADWEATSDDVIRSLVETVVQKAAPPELVTWSATLLPEQSNAFAACGFEATDTDQTKRGLPCLLVRGVADDASLPAGLEALIDMHQWDLRMIFTSLA